MNKIALLPILSVMLVSCDPEMHRFPNEVVKSPNAEAAQPAQADVAASPRRTVAPAPIKKATADSTSPFLTPAQDKNLPSTEQLADGAASSIGTGSTGTIAPTTQPSTAIKPPTIAPAPEDDLAPAE